MVLMSLRGETKVKHRSYSVIISLIYKKKPKK